VFDAVGARMLRLPMTPARVLAAIAVLDVAKAAA
jgi:CO/xanthine dehydrogenase Mo-binding subunit